MMSWIYQNVLKPILFKFDPDDVHTLFVKIGVVCGNHKILTTLIEKIYGKPSSLKNIEVDSLKFKGPVLLSAGFDYNAHLSHILFSMGFAGEEVGSVTARPCKGNPPPHLKRLVRSKSIQVYKGLKNDGVDQIIERIKQKRIPSEFVMGISIAKTNDEKCSSHDGGIEDYCYSFRRLNEENIGAFYTINISCPNAFGGEDFATPLKLRDLLDELKKIPCSKPIYIKMPINKSWDELKELLEVIHEQKINGVVIGNLNKNYADLDFSEEISDSYRGGLSGRPCRKLSTMLVKKTRELYPQMTIMGCGGILSPEDAMEKLEAGADLVQLISGMIFTGPHLMQEINQQFQKIEKMSFVKQVNFEKKNLRESIYQ
jgi:dihydroorotate dehydrogenase